jgi:predicted nucleotidyltransferase component of viral defense system
VNSDYIQTVRLLLDIAPAIFTSPVFAMKGGTALNLFVQDMPRLSVDIDVVFVPHDLDRTQALETISQELSAAQSRIASLGHQSDLRKSKESTESKLFVRGENAEVKVEVNFVFRGTVLPPQQRALTPSAQAMFTSDIQIPVLATEELYGGKLVAALDRQHPRDLFDVQFMLASRGWDETLLNCFVIYLAGHNRPAHEVLFPKDKPLDGIYREEFSGMTTKPVELRDLEATRRRMIDELPRALRQHHREFLLSMMRGEPDWTLLPYPHLNRLPALQWKLQNLQALKRNPAKFAQQHDELATRLKQYAGSPRSRAFTPKLRGLSM